VIAVGAGKGGVGKTFVATNLSVALSRLGHRVVAVDTDLEGANLHTCLGVANPQLSLADFVSGREEDLRKLLLDTDESNLQIIAATHAHLGDMQPSQSRRLRLIRELRRLPTDYVVIDLGAGSHSAVLDYFLMADHSLLVMVPQPTSVENAYTFLRAAFYRKLQTEASSHEMRNLVSTSMDPRNELGIRTPLELIREIEGLGPVEQKLIREIVQGFRPRIMINEVRSAENVKLGFAVVSVCRKFFGIEADYLGYVNHEDEARMAVTSRKSLIGYHERSDAAGYVQRIAAKLIRLSDDSRGSVRGRREKAQRGQTTGGSVWTSG
jgi:flagellar biosynthesis protein FlhG